MNLIDRLKGKSPADAWYPGEGAYPSLFDLGAHAGALKGKGGVFALWHLGVRPQWLRVGAAGDLGLCLKAAADELRDSPFRGNGGLYVAWAFVAPARRPGVVTHLRARLQPVLRDMNLTGETAWAEVPVAVQFAPPPGTTEPYVSS